MSSLFRSLFHGNSKHKKLSEDWASTREPVVEGVTFYCKYLGNTAVTEAKGAESTASAIERIILTAMREARKPDRVSLRVGQQGIHMSDAVNGEVLLETSIYRISYCSADAHYDHVFAFIATDDDDHCMCHAFLCPKKKMAQAVTLTIAQAFSLAYEGWKMSQKNNNEIYGHEEAPAQVMMGPAVGKSQFGSVSHNQAHSTPSSRSTSPIPIRADLGSTDSKSKGYQSSQMLLIDLDKDCNSEQDLHSSNTNLTSTTDHKDSDKETSIPDKSLKGVLNPRRLAVLEQDLDQINDEFSRLAMARGDKGPQLPGTSPRAWVDLDHAASTAPLPVSPSENGYLLSANSVQDDWTWGRWGQSPPNDGSNNYSRSPNTAFLNSCQSPPSNRPFGFFTSRDPFSAHSPPDPGLGEATFDPFGLCQSPPDPFTVACSPTDPFNMSSQSPPDPFGLSQSPPDPFSVSQSPPDPFNAPQCSPDPFTVSQSPSDPFSIGKSADPVTASQNHDPFTATSHPVDPFAPIKSSSTPSNSTHQSDSLKKEELTNQERNVGKLKSVPSITVTGCGGARSPWSSNGAFDNSDVICS